MAEAILIKRSTLGAPRKAPRAESRAVSGGRIVFSIILSFVPPLIAFLALNPDGPLSWILAYLASVEVLFLFRAVRRSAQIAKARGKEPANPVRSLLQGADRAVPWLLGILLTAGALTILVGLNITPASAYLAWFALVKAGTAGGTIAYMFVVKFAFFSAVFAGLALTADALFPLFGLAAIDLLLWGVILENHLMSVWAAVMFLVAILYYAGRRLGRINGRSVWAVVQVTLVTAFVALPFSTVIINNSLIDSLFEVHLDGLVAQVFPNFPFLYNVPGYGNSLSNTQLGQRPALTSRPVFQVTGPPGATVYLRTAVYDTYTGTGWRLSDYEKRIGERSKLYYNYSQNAVPPAQLRTLTTKVLIDFYSSLPHTLDTIGFYYPKGPIPDIRYGSLNSGYVLASPLSRGDVVTDVIDTSPPPELSPPADPFGANKAAFDRHPFPRYGEHGQAQGIADTTDLPGSASEDLPRWLTYAQTIPSRYSMTPREEYIDLQAGDLPKEVRNLAASLQEPTESGTLNAIRTYLETNYVYSLDTKAAGPAGDTVDDFLFHSKTGYCVHFATAFVILARLDGIPARYVTGFLVYLPAGTGTTTVTGLSAHSWAETWSPTAGWITQEATPPMLASSFSDPSFYSDFNPTDSSLTARQLEAVLGNRVPVDPSPVHVEKPVSAAARDRTMLLAAVGSASAAGIAALLYLFLTIRMAPEETRLARIVRKIARNAPGSNLPDPGQAGWSAWANAMAGRKPERRAVTLRAGVVILRHFFDGRGPNPRDLPFLTTFYRWTYFARLKERLSSAKARVRVPGAPSKK